LIISVFVSQPAGWQVCGDFLLLPPSLYGSKDTLTVYE